MFQDQKRVKSAHFILYEAWNNGAFKFSWEVHAYKFVGRDYDVVWE